MSTWTPCPLHPSQQVPCRECVFASAEYAALQARVTELETERREVQAAALEAAADEWQRLQLEAGLRMPKWVSPFAKWLRDRAAEVRR